MMPKTCKVCGDLTGGGYECSCEKDVRIAELETEMAAQKPTPMPEGVGDAVMIAEKLIANIGAGAHPAYVGQAVALKTILTTLDAAQESLDACRTGNELGGAMLNEARAKLCEAQAEVARLKRELAKSTQAEVEATNACRVLKADARRCSRSVEQVKADVERLKGELAYLSDDCPPSECAVVKKAEAALAEAQKECEHWREDAKALRSALQDVGREIDRYFGPMVRRLGGRDAMNRGWSKRWCALAYARNVPPCPDCQALRDAIRNAFHDGARDPVRRAYPALIELEKALAKGEIVSASCPDCKVLRERVEAWAKGVFNVGEDGDPYQFGYYRAAQMALRILRGEAGA